MNFLKALLGVVVAISAMAVTLVVGTVSALVAACVTGALMIFGIILALTSLLWLIIVSLWAALFGKKDTPT